MLFDVAPGNPVRDALKAKRRQEPVKNRWRIARRDSVIQTSVTDFFVNLIEER